MKQNIQPEKIYVGFFKLGVLISVILGLVASIFFIYFLRSSGFEISWTFAALLPLIIFIGYYLKYQISMKVEGFGGKTIASNNQRHIKQVAYVLLPIALLLIITLPSYFISRYTLLGYILLIATIIISEILFFWRLKNLERAEGKDVGPVLTTTEIVLLIAMILIVGSLIAFSILAS